MNTPHDLVAEGHTKNLFFSLGLATYVNKPLFLCSGAGVVRSVGDYASSLGETVKSTVQENVSTLPSTHVKSSVTLMVSLVQPSSDGLYRLKVVLCCY